MNDDPHPIVKRTAERIKRHSIAIQEAQKQLREAVRVAEQDHVSEERLYA